MGVTLIVESESMVASGSDLYGDFGALGLWKWNGAAWTLLSSSNPESMVVSGSDLYGDFGALGLWKWNGAAWTLLSSSNPESMVVSGSYLYGDFGALGLWKWNGAKTPANLPSSSNPESMVVSGSLLYGNFGVAGLWKRNGAAWVQLSWSNPESMAVSGSLLYGDFGAAGLWRWNGGDELHGRRLSLRPILKAWWPQIQRSMRISVHGAVFGCGMALHGLQLTSSNPESMVASDSTLYAEFGAGGLWRWNGTAWTRV